MGAGDVFDDVLVQHHAVAHRHQRVKAQVDFALPGGAYFVVMYFHRNARVGQLQHDLTTDILQGVGRRHREVAFLPARAVTQIRPIAVRATVPNTLF